MSFGAGCGAAARFRAPVPLPAGVIAARNAAMRREYSVKCTRGGDGRIGSATVSLDYGLPDRAVVESRRAYYRQKARELNQ